MCTNTVSLCNADVNLRVYHINVFQSTNHSIKKVYSAIITGKSDFLCLGHVPNP